MVSLIILNYFVESLIAIFRSKACCVKKQRKSQKNGEYCPRHHLAAVFDLTIALEISVESYHVSLEIEEPESA
jgi:hypothetical protein